MGYFREWLEAVSFASLLGCRVEQLAKHNHCFVGSGGWVGFLGAPNLLNVQISLCVSECGSEGFPVGQLNQLFPALAWRCAVCNKCQPGRLWFSLHCTATAEAQGLTPVCRFDVFLSQVVLFLTTLPVAEEMWHCLLFVLLRAIPSWVNPGPLLGLPAWNRRWKSVKLL